MGLITRLAARRTAVLVAEVPGWGYTRCTLEQRVRSRGWRLADSPADADLLVVCGEPGPRFAAAVELVWAQLPGPRSRVQALDPADVAAALDAAAGQLADEATQRQDAQDRPAGPAQGVPATDTSVGTDDAPGDGGADADARPPAWDDPHPGAVHEGEQGHHDTDPTQEHGDMDHGDMDHGDMDHGDMDHGDMDHGDMDHGDMDHGDMDHGDMDMPMPGGIPLAGGGGADQLPDPDQLDLDVLHVPLGPVLPHWPAGLLLHTTLQGELVVAARAEVLEAARTPPAGGSLHGTTAGRWDAAATLLAVAGWSDAATAAVRLRDAALTGPVPEREAQRLARRVRRSRLLRWSLRGVGVLPEGDAADRLGHWLSGSAHGAPITLTELADLVTGLDLATVRLVVASLDLDTSVREPVEVGAA
ncbi:hypothetical protein [Modestobacter italicus]|uniref:hypothetical protein n=1 Tax=Modestobacter italicus (strain DSM 44449 / CECT 9708 / BC 501) TaxID=2732864 RepID=UPI001C976C7F|nr:hypothetical protein [Modestobacter italicus]